jgi:hypothetical protein
MPSIPIQSITDLAAANVTGNETVPLVQQVGAAYYTYKTPIKNFFYNGAVPPSALSASPLTWTYSGRVGVGTASPSSFAKLDVQGGRSFFAANNEQYAIGARYSSAGGIVYFGATDSSATPNAVISNASGTALMTLSTNGNVGIGTTTPTSRLDVSGIIKSTGLSSSGTMTLTQNNNSLRFTDTSGTFPKLSMQADNNFVFYGTNASGADRAIYSIGQRSNTSTFNFSVPVTIAGNNTAGDPGLVIAPNTLGATKRSSIVLDNWNVGQDVNGNGTKDFYIYQSSAASTRCYINTSGDVGIGTSAPSTKLDVAGGISVAQSTGINLNAAGGGSIRGQNQDGASNTLANVQIQSWFGIGFSPNIANQTIPINENAVFINCRTGTLNARGAITAPSFTSSSSKRFKTNINNLTNSLETINQLQGVAYEWKETGKSDIGLIAEEVNEILPDLVKKDEDDAPEGIDYGKLTAVLIEAVKELTQKVSDLESKLK